MSSVFRSNIKVGAFPFLPVPRKLNGESRRSSNKKKRSLGRKESLNGHVHSYHLLQYLTRQKIEVGKREAGSSNFSGRNRKRLRANWHRQRTERKEKSRLCRRLSDVGAIIRKTETVNQIGMYALTVDRGH